MSIATEVVLPAIVAVAAVRVGIRIRKKRRTADPQPLPGPTGAPAIPAISAKPPRFEGGGFLGDTGMIAGREIRERLRGRFFKIVTLVLLAVVAAAIIIPTIHSSKSASTPTEVGVVGSVSGAARQQIVTSTKQSGTPVRLVQEQSLHQARAGIHDGRLTVVVQSTGPVLVKTPSAAKGTTTAGQVAQTIAQILGYYDTIAAQHLTTAQAAAVANAKPRTIESLQPASHRHSSGRTTSIVGLILTFIMLTQYLGWTLMGVLEEKASRVVEVLLATVRPVQLLGGKVLGIGAVALAQAAIVVAFALVLAEAVGSDLLHGTGPLTVLSTLLWLVLGYGFYSWVYAAAGSMAARQDQVQSLALPLSIPIIVGYVVCISSASEASPSLLIKVFAYLPPTAPFGMPLLVGYSAATWWEFTLSALVTVASTVVVARLAAGVYRRAVLRTGRRVTFKELLAAGH